MQESKVINMIRISVIDDPLYQWDRGRRVRICTGKDESIDSVHYNNGMVAEVTAEDGCVTAPIPNMLLQTAQNITVYAVVVSADGTRTLHDSTFQVRAKQKPDDYVYTETEIKTWENHEERIKALEANVPSSGGGSDGIPIPGTAEVGQTIVVKAVDENSKPTEWAAVDLPSGGGGETPDEFATLFHKVFETDVANTDAWGGESHLYNYTHFWTVDTDGNDVDADGVYLRIHVPPQTDNIVTAGDLKVYTGFGKPQKVYSWYSEQPQAIIGWPKFSDTNGTEIFAEANIDLRNQTYTAQIVYGPNFKSNFYNSKMASVTPFPVAIAKNNWTALSGLSIQLVSGSLPAGTEIMIYARKRNPNKILNLPKWGETI